MRLIKTAKEINSLKSKYLLLLLFTIPFVRFSQSDSSIFRCGSTKPFAGIYQYADLVALAKVNRFLTFDKWDKKMPVVFWLRCFKNIGAMKQKSIIKVGQEWWKNEALA